MLKLCCINLLLALCIALAGCGGGDDDEPKREPISPVNCVERPELCK